MMILIQVALQKENYRIAIQNLVQTSLRSIIGEMQLDDALSSRDTIKATLKASISDDISDWGITLKTVEIQDINPSPTMQQAMEQQAAAERAKKVRARIEPGQPLAELRGEYARTPLCLDDHGPVPPERVQFDGEGGLALHDETDGIARRQRLGQMPGVAEQRLAMAEGANDDIALVDGRHPPRCEFELVVTRLVVQNADRDEHAFLARDVGREAQLVAEFAVLRDRGDLVHDDAFHDAVPPARVCSEPGSDRMRA